jgi:hypothetical protein
MGLIAAAGDNEQELNLKWTRLLQADSYEVQSSPDPILPNSWVHATTVSDPKIRLIGLTSGQKRWVRARGVNRLGAGPWSNPSCRMIP